MKKINLRHMIRRIVVLFIICSFAWAAWAGISYFWQNAFSTHYYEGVVEIKPVQKGTAAVAKFALHGTSYPGSKMDFETPPPEGIQSGDVVEIRLWEGLGAVAERSSLGSMPTAVYPAVAVSVRKKGEEKWKYLFSYNPLDQ